MPGGMCVCGKLLQVAIRGKQAGSACRAQQAAVSARATPQQAKPVSTTQHQAGHAETGKCDTYPQSGSLSTSATVAA